MCNKSKCDARKLLVMCLTLLPEGGIKEDVRDFLYGEEVLSKFTVENTTYQFFRLKDDKGHRTTTVGVKATVDGQVIGSAVARLHPNDPFDSKKGKFVAMKFLLKDLNMSRKERRQVWAVVMNDPDIANVQDFDQEELVTINYTSSLGD